MDLNQEIGVALISGLSGREDVKTRKFVKLDQRRVDVLPTTIKKCLPRIFVRQSFLLSFRHITDTKNPCVLVLTRCHVTEINYVDRGAAARAPLQ